MPFLRLSSTIVASAWLHGHFVHCWSHLKIKFGRNDKFLPINTTCNSEDSCVQFDGSGEMFVPDSIGVLGIKDDADAAAAAADPVCAMDFIVEDTYDKEEDMVSEEIAAAYEEDEALCATVPKATSVLCSLAGEEVQHLGDRDGRQLPSVQGESTPQEFLLPNLNLPTTGDDVPATKVNLSRDFDLNKLPIRVVESSEREATQMIISHTWMETWRCPGLLVE